MPKPHVFRVLVATAVLMIAFVSLDASVSAQSVKAEGSRRETEIT